jgi:hypothetical protein
MHIKSGIDDGYLARGIPVKVSNENESVSTKWWQRTRLLQLGLDQMHYVFWECRKAMP